jgi:hypothetical protein
LDRNFRGYTHFQSVLERSDGSIELALDQGSRADSVMGKNYT